MATLDADDHKYLEALLERVNDDLLRHEKALFGNGQPGLIDRVTQRDGTLGIHAAAIGTLEKAMHHHGNKDRATLGGLSALVAGIVAGIIAALQQPH